ncbi:PIG-L family deacetylase [Leucobacter komagatae]|uniref:LmbE-like protein n=1 Tax=Leucobacter komagatae TaxID=55969 RepID=A0A0D0IP76_9MICO|nr:PIG-L family deacetylase [Leucobacter komagatae]KIP51348.1 LmbE-like protein [Leucobacter komagatae]
MNTEVAAWFGGAKRVMFVHAHPDDETIATGGTLAALAEAGLEPLLVTLTRGERGEVVSGPFSQLQGTDGLAPHRQAELTAALAMLGVERHVFLGVPPARAAELQPTIYEDSGMQWLADGLAGPGAEATADALTVVPAVESLNDLLAAAHDAAAGAIVSYDDGGGYGHPDHVHAHRIARAVAYALDLPFWEIVPEAEGSGEQARPAAGNASVDGDGDGAPPTLEVHDITPWLDRKTVALRAHATQLTVEGDEIVHVGGQRQAISPVETFRFTAAS